MDCHPKYRPNSASVSGRGHTRPCVETCVGLSPVPADVELSPKGDHSPCPALRGAAQIGAAHQPLCCQGTGWAPAKVHQHIQLHRQNHTIKRDKNPQNKNTAKTKINTVKCDISEGQREVSKQFWNTQQTHKMLTCLVVLIKLQCHQIYINKEPQILTLFKTKEKHRWQNVPFANFQLKIILSKGHLFTNVSELFV